ncbi:molybdopterin converting factor subunit 1 [Ammoniphilus sp. YIM 78166]|uniref:molybdopterin converting factor subunit 1 n=1 Tax=Ammoniphilus sp. YIM 78166 TaxID=1644106 RepID=UPI00106FE271|nr:molybdopterin converting factor subunit 1 [Ammoniphilus sp. YIM 78166]
MVRILLFAGLAEVAGSSVISLEMDHTEWTVRAVREKLSERYPALRDLLEKSMVAVNQEYAMSADPVKETDEIAFIPPVSGG